MSDKNAGRRSRRGRNGSKLEAAKKAQKANREAQRDARRALAARSPIGAAGWWIGAAVGLVACAPIAIGVQSWQEDRQATDLAARDAAEAHVDDVPPPVDAIQQLLDQDSLVAVDPLLADRVPSEDLQQAEEILAASPVPARLAYLSYPEGESGYTTGSAGPQWWTSVGEDGHYVVLWSNGRYDSGGIGMREEYVEARTEGQPGPALVRVAEEMATWEAQPEPEPYEPGDFDYWGGVLGGLGAAALLGAVGVVPVFLLLRWIVGLRRRKVA